MKRPTEGKYVALSMTPQGDCVAQPVPGSCVRLLLPVSLVLLRRVAVKGIANRDLLTTLNLRAEESLPEALDRYYLDHWAIPSEYHGLAALPKAPLCRARQQIVEAGARVSAVVVPELCSPKEGATAVVFWVSAGDLLVCLWREGVLHDWLTVPPFLSTSAVIDQCSAMLPKTPAEVYFSGADAANRELVTAAANAWPQAEVLTLAGSEGAGLVSAPAVASFQAFLRESEQQRAGAAELWRLGVAGFVAAVGIWFLSYGQLRNLEQQVEQLQHRTSLLKIQATRSEKVAARSGEALREIRELRQMTVERPGILAVLRVLSDSLPPRIKLQNIVFERSGLAAIEGVAESELDVTRLLERLGNSSEWQQPTLSFAQRETDKSGSARATENNREDKVATPELGSNQGPVRFRLEAHLPQPLLRLPAAEEEPAGATTAAASVEEAT